MDGLDIFLSFITCLIQSNFLSELALIIPCLVFDNFQEHQWQVGVGTLADITFGGAPRVPSLDFLGENLRPDLHWLCLTIALLKVLF